MMNHVQRSPVCQKQSLQVRSRERPFPDITFQWCGLRWAIHTKGIIAPLLSKSERDYSGVRSLIVKLRNVDCRVKTLGYRVCTHTPLAVAGWLTLSFQISPII